MTRHTAEWILTPQGLRRGGAVTLAEGGRIESVASAVAGPVDEGLLLPGWVNAHCHLELSHLAGAVPGGEGMAGFARLLIPMRDQWTPAQQEAAASSAIEAVWQLGTAAVGDIANGTASFAGKRARAELAIHSFIEVFGLNPSEAQARAEAAVALSLEAPPPATITLHAPYSCPDSLVDAVMALASGRLSLHLLESPDERQYLETGQGPLRELFETEWGFPALRPTRPNALEHLLAPLPPGLPTLLIHLTELRADERTRLEALRDQGRVLYEVLCPRSNLFLHGKLPDAARFDLRSPWVCLGTDSLASCPSLDLLDELRTLTVAWPEADTEGLYFAATRNGARALGFDQLGELRPGTAPRLLRLHPVSAQGRVTDATRATVLA